MIGYTAQSICTHSASPENFCYHWRRFRLGASWPHALHASVAPPLCALGQRGNTRLELYWRIKSTWNRKNLNEVIYFIKKKTSFWRTEPLFCRSLQEDAHYSKTKTMSTNANWECYYMHFKYLILQITKCKSSDYRYHFTKLHCADYIGFGLFNSTVLFIFYQKKNLIQSASCGCWYFLEYIPYKATDMRLQNYYAPYVPFQRKKLHKMLLFLEWSITRIIAALI